MKRNYNMKKQSGAKKLTMAMAAILAAASLTACGSTTKAAEPKAAEPKAEQTAEAVTPKMEGTAAQTPAAVTPNQTVQSGGTETNETVITEADAKKIALDHAQAAEKDAVFVKVKMDRDDGRTEYEVEFYIGNKEYDYEIDAVTGEIMSYDYDIETKVPAITPDQSTGTGISIEDAKKLALSKVPGADETQIRIKEEQDDGIRKYEGKIVYGEMEYDFEIDAATGTMLEWDAESIYD